MFGHTIDYQKRDSKNNKLHNAILVGDLEGVKEALAEGAQLDASHYVSSPLAQALMCPSLDVFKYLLACKANPNVVFSNGETLLGMAILKSTPERVSLLVWYGANSNQPNKKGVTPLQIAKEMTDITMMIALLSAGANINWNNKYFSQHLKEDIFRFLKFCINFYIDQLVKSIEKEDEIIKCIGVLNQLTKNIEGESAIYPAQPGRFPADDLKNARETTRNKLTEKITSVIKEFKELESLQNANVGLQAIMDNLKIIKGWGSVGFTKKASMAALEKCMEVLNEKIKHEEEKARQLELEKTIGSLFFCVIDPIAPVIGVVDESALHTKEEALFTAINEGDVEAVERLILDGANLNYQGPFHSPLTSAASKNKEAVVEKLLDLGANIDWDALSQTKTMKACVVRVLNKMIFQDIDDLFQFKYEPNNHLALINQKTTHFVSPEFKDERADVRKYFVKKMNEKRKELASVIDLVKLKGVRDRFRLIEQTMAIIQSPEGEKEKDSMKQLRQWINRLNERIAKLEGEEKTTTYQSGLTQFASVKPAAADEQPELGPDAGYTL